MMFRATNNIPRLMVSQSAILFSDHFTSYTTISNLQDHTNKQVYDDHTLSFE
jgi:hypothetical protein